MSADTTPLLISTPSKRYAWIEQAVENISFPESIFHYLSTMHEFEYEKDAQECLDLLVKQCEYVEYEQMNITLPYEKEVYKWINLGKAVSDAVGNTFPNDVMRAIKEAGNKNSDGIVNFQYDYYVDERTILHNWYTRWEIMCTEIDLERASHNYCAYIQEANNKELEYRDKELNEQLPNDWHIKIDQDSYELYYKWDICVLGSIRDWRRNNVLEYIQEYKI